MRLPGVKLRKPPKIGEGKPATIRLQGGETILTCFDGFTRDQFSFRTPKGIGDVVFHSKLECELVVVLKEWYMLGVVVRLVNTNTSKEFAVLFNIFGYTQVSDLQDPGSGFETFFAPWEAFLRRMESNWQDREEFLFVQGDFWGSFSEDHWTLVKLGKRWKATQVPESFSQMLGRSLEPTSWKIIFAENYRPGKYER